MKPWWALLALVLGCGSVGQSLEGDAQQDVASIDSGVDATIRDSAGDSPADAAEECVPQIGSWPCEPIFFGDGSFDAGAVNVESGLSRAYVTRSLVVAGSVALNPWQPDGGFLGAQAPEMAFGLIQRGELPWDPAGIYVVLPSTEVPFDVGLQCVWYCGFHEFAVVPVDGGVGLMRYAVLSDCPDVCSAFPPGSPTPNGNLSADAMVSVLAHELAEAATDPDPYSGWSTWLNSETGDLCAWNFGPVFVLPNGAPYNQEVGGRKVLIQRSWSNDLGCTLGARGFDADAAVPIWADAGLVGWAPGVGPMYYRGGRVMDQPMRVYWLWLGQWTERATVEPILTQFVDGLGASGWWDAPSRYFSEPALYGADGGVE